MIIIPFNVPSPPLPLFFLPSLAWNDPHLFAVPVWCHYSSLPPFVIGGIDDMEDVPISKAEALAGESTIFCLFIVKQRPVRPGREGKETGRRLSAPEISRGQTNASENQYRTTVWTLNGRLPTKTVQRVSFFYDTNVMTIMHTSCAVRK